MQITITKNEEETKELAKKLAQDVLNDDVERKEALLITLEGNLGAGKTTFTKGFAEGLGISEDVTSPTFLILKEYILPESQKLKAESYNKFYHMDCYRLEDETGAKDIGLKEVLKDPKNIILVEWPEKIKKALPKKGIKIKFYYISENKRKLAIG